MIDHSAEWVKLTTGEEPSNPEEDARVSLLVRAMLRGFETQCYQCEYGLIEAQAWQALRTAIRSISTLPGVNRYWQQLKPMMSERLRKVTEDE